MSSKPEAESDDVTPERVAARAEDIEKKFSKQKALKQWLEHGKVLLSMIGDYVSGKYREVPYWVISAVSLALLYVLNPLDIIPDVLPGFGYLDDATVLAFCIKLIEKDLEKYKDFLAQRSKGSQGATVIDVEVEP